MRRKIEFRAKDQKTKGWVFGSLVSLKAGLLPSSGLKHRIVRDGEYGIEVYEVMEDTVGQYIGLKDIKGKEIYEGDILRMTDHEEEVSWNTRVGLYGEVEYSYLDYDYCLLEYMNDWVDYEVIGNIYDDQGLLKNEEEKG